MKNTKIVLKMFYSFISKVIQGGILILSLSLIHIFIESYEIPFEWVFKLLYYFVGVGVLYYIGKGLEVKKQIKN